MKSVAEDLNSTTIQRVLKDLRASYRVLRAFHALPQNVVSGIPLDDPRSQEFDGRLSIDIDEAIISNEHYIRSRGSEANVDDRYLVSLDDLTNLLAKPPNFLDKPPPENTQLTIVRKDPPKGGLEFLDEMRKRKLEIIPDSRTFSSVFDRITNGILHGLDWTNVFVAGGIALTTLLHTLPEKDNDTSVRDPDIDLYIYGLGSEDANRKAEEVYDIWAANLPATADQKLVVKNAKTITLLPSYPHRRIQINLKLPASPTDILLNFDLDACAIGFDGSRVLMLPRCARAIETGYSVFTMDLVWGHHLGDRRATQESRVLKYAKRGFGIRFLPSYAKSLEFDVSQVKKTSKLYSGEDESPESYLLRFQRDRHPFGRQEPGLKTLKRIAYLGADFVHRLTFGPTPLTIYPHPSSTRHRQTWSSEAQWKEMVEEAKRALEELRLENASRCAAGVALFGTTINFSDLDSEKIHHGLPDGRNGLGNFELFTRHSEAWRRYVRHEALFNTGEIDSPTYDSNTYEDLPNYFWDQDFDLGQVARSIDECNDDIFNSVKIAICEKLGIAQQLFGCKLASPSDGMDREEFVHSKYAFADAQDQQLKSIHPLT